MADDIIASARAMTVVTEGQYNTLGQPASSITPATLTAMVGMAKGEALTIAPSVTSAMAKLQAEITANTSLAPAAAIALNNLTTQQSSVFNPNDQGGFGKLLGQVHGHINNATDITNATTFLSNSSYGDFGSGITDMGSMADHGLTNSFGSLKGAGSAMASTGSMFNGIDVKNFGTPTGLVQSLNNNKLGNATGVNALLAKNGVPLNDLNNPVYTDQINQVMGSINNPAAINTAADQFGITDPFGGLPSYSGSDSSLYNTQNVFGGAGTPPVATTVPTAGTSTFGAPTTTGFPTASGYSTGSTAFGAASAPEVGNAGGIQSLKDLSDYTKLANPADTAGFSGGASGLASKFHDMGGGRIVDATAAPNFFSGIQSVTTPLTNAAAPSLNALMSQNSSTINGLIGSGSGKNGVPNANDFIHSVSGGAVYDNINNGVTADNIAALNSKISQSTSLFSTAGITPSAGPATQNLSGVMSFATKLPQYGKDLSTGGLGDSLRNMANSSSQYGEAVKASLAEGKNNSILSANGMGPLKTNPFEGVPSYTGDDGSLQNGSAAKMLGGGGSNPPPTPSRGTVSGSSTQGGSFGSEQIQGQVGTGTAGLKGTPFDVTGRR